MHKDELIERIFRRVLEKLSEKNNQQQKAALALPKILVITNSECQKANTDDYQNIFGNKAEIHYSYSCEKEVNLNDYSCILVTNLDNGSLSMLSKGEFESTYLQLIGKATMMGKRIFIPLEEIEFKRYEQTMPSSLLRLFIQKLNVIKQWKIEIKSLNEIVKEFTHADMKGLFTGETESNALCKKIITNKDIVLMMEKGYSEIIVAKSSIITDIAMERIKANSIDLRRL